MKLEMSLNPREFWTRTISLSEAEKRESMLSAWEQARFERAREVHALMRRRPL